MQFNQLLAYAQPEPYSSSVTNAVSSLFIGEEYSRLGLLIHTYSGIGYMDNDIVTADFSG
ncbi:hypothetical protein D3C80_1213460 [compost metagenome]